MEWLLMYPTLCYGATSLLEVLDSGGRASQAYDRGFQSAFAQPKVGGSSGIPDHHGTELGNRRPIFMTSLLAL